jgi:thioredoxin-like negative regulator of GroEL
MARDVVEANPQYPALLYNLACCESLAGRREDAVQHLRSAIERSDQLRRLAAEDTDIAAIRDDPAIKELLG